MKSYQNFALCVVCLISLFMVGCTSPGKRSSATTSSSYQQAFRPQQDFLSSAENYLHLADQVEPPARYEYLLQAGEMFVKGEIPSKAQALLDKIPADSLSSQLQQQRQLLQAEIFVQNKQATAALNALQSLQNGRYLPKSYQARFLETLVNAKEQLGNPLEIAKARAQLDPYLSNNFALTQNRQAIWRTLNSAPLSTLKQQQIKDDKDNFAGWAALVYITRQFDEGSTRMTNALNKWQTMFPTHPGRGFLPGQQEPLYENLEMPKQIALLLPLQGAYKEASHAIRDGFLSSFYAIQRKYPNAPTIRIYDTTKTKDAYSVYLQAVKEGADFVVGPLMKDDVIKLSQHAGRLPTPVLALNQSPNVRATSGLYQFALSPEGEAKLLAAKTYQDGYRRALVVVPNNNWGKRIAKAFSVTFENQGAKILKISFVDPNKDQATAIRDLLNIDQSHSRGLEVKNMIKEKVEFQPRRRQDVDVVILAAPPEQARQLRPLFDFYFAQNLPIYATSSIYSGTPNPKKDRDMNGIIFSDMPWLLSQPSQASKLLQNNPKSLNLRLYAMGMDAFKLALHLKRLEASPQIGVRGATGTLYLNRKNQIERQLSWAKMRNGVPERL